MHDSANRLIELINKNKRGSVYLDDVTEAFSVERLNKDFFNGYKTQYKRFVDTLTNTKQHRDYVKKLLGRLVFCNSCKRRVGWVCLHQAPNGKMEIKIILPNL